MLTYAQTKCLHKDEIRDLIASVLDIYGRLGANKSTHGITLPLSLPRQTSYQPVPITRGEHQMSSQDIRPVEGSGKNMINTMKKALPAVPKMPKVQKKPSMKSLTHRKKADVVLSGEVPKRRGGKRRACDLCRQLRVSRLSFSLRSAN